MIYFTMSCDYGFIGINNYGFFVEDYPFLNACKIEEIDDIIKSAQKHFNLEISVERFKKIK